jgi:tetratricopeptide (TPR) repeat protein
MKVSKKQSPAGKHRESSPFKEAVRQMDEAIALFFGKNKKKAAETFQSIIDKFPEEKMITDRCQTYIRICERLAGGASQTATTAEELYVRGSWHMNKGELDQAIENLLAAMKIDPKSEHIHYTIAAAYARQGTSEAAAKHLAQAIQSNPDNREFVLNDADFIDVFNTPAIETVLEGTSS